MEQGEACYVSDNQRNGECQQSEDAEPSLVSAHAVGVHLKGSKEHDIVESNFAEQLEGVVAFKDVEAILAHGNASQHHADDVGDAQLAHDDRGEKDDKQHHEEDDCGVGYRKIAGDVGHIIMCIFV